MNQGNWRKIFSERRGNLFRDRTYFLQAFEFFPCKKINEPMQYMIIEKFKQGKVKEVYKRFDEKGRLMPDGLHFINSWITEDATT